MMSHVGFSQVNELVVFVCSGTLLLCLNARSLESVRPPNRFLIAGLLFWSGSFSFILPPVLVLVP